MIRIYLMRHGDAEPRSEEVTEAARSLTPKGEKQAKAAARALEALGEAPTFYAASTLVRAKQTAQLVSAGLSGEEPLQTDTLDPGLDPAKTAAWLNRQKSESALLAGHAPSIGELASWLASSKVDVGIHFKKGAIMCLSAEDDLGPGACEIEWFLTPKQLKAIGAAT